MNKIAILCISLLWTTLSFAQDWNFQKPNYKKIEENIKIKSSKLYYPKLLDRYKSGDSTLTTEEKRHLYYGYIFQPTYSPYSRTAYSDSLQILLKKQKHSEIELDKIIEFGDSIQIKNPFDLASIHYQLYAFEEQKEEWNFKTKSSQLKAVFDALISSGNGAAKETAFYVIYTSHEYDLINILGLEYAGSQSLVDHYDYLKLKKNDAEVEGLYFNISPCLNSLAKMFKK